MHNVAPYTYVHTDGRVFTFFVEMPLLHVEDPVDCCWYENKKYIGDISYEELKEAIIEGHIDKMENLGNVMNAILIKGGKEVVFPFDIVV